MEQLIFYIPAVWVLLLASNHFPRTLICCGLATTAVPLVTYGIIVMPLGDFPSINFTLGISTFYAMFYCLRRVLNQEQVIITSTAGDISQVCIVLVAAYATWNLRGVDFITALGDVAVITAIGLSVGLALCFFTILVMLISIVCSTEKDSVYNE